MEDDVIVISITTQEICSKLERLKRAQILKYR